MRGRKIVRKGRIFVVQKDAGPGGASDTSTVMLFHSDDLTSSSSSLEILSRRLLAPLQKMQKSFIIENFEMGEKTHKKQGKDSPWSILKNNVLY